MLILALPAELLVEIFKRLPHFTDILACGGVCHVFRNVIETSTDLNYRIELERAGMIDNPHCKFSTATRLEMLRERERAWGNFDGKLIMKDLKVPSTSTPLYMVTPSTVVLGYEGSQQGFEATGFHSIKMPSTGEEVSSTAWSTVDVRETILDIGTAIEEHDLLAYVTYEPDPEVTPSRSRLVLVLRHNSNPLKPHKDASFPRIPICSFTYGRPLISIEIAGVNIAIVTMISQEGGGFPKRLHVFDWKTGVNKMPTPLEASCANPVFLREDILLSPMEDFHFLVYYIAPSYSPSPSVQLLLLLHLPPLTQNQRIESIESQCSPSPTESSMFPKKVSEQRPFFDDPMAAIIVFSFTIIDFGSGEDPRVRRDQVSMVIHRKSILDLIPSHSLSGARSTPVEHVPWESWGPPVSRWFRINETARDYRMHSCGQRYVQHTIGIGPGWVGGEPSSRTTIFDFNPWNVRYVRRILAAHPGYPDGFEIDVVGEDIPFRNPRNEAVEHPGTVYLSHVLSEDGNQLGRLPYVRCTSTRWPSYSAVFMDEERLIGIHTNDYTYKILSMDVIYLG